MKIVLKQDQLEILDRIEIFVKIGGYYGFLKVTMAEVMSQIPKQFLADIVAFSFDPEKSGEILNEDYQILPLILYKEGNQKELERLPKFEGLIKERNKIKAEALRLRVQPIVIYGGNEAVSIFPGKINSSFMTIGIQISMGGSNLWKTNSETPITIPYKRGEKFSIYQEFAKDADIYEPDYLYTISQIPEGLITVNTIGFEYRMVDYFKTNRGVLHKIDYCIIEKI